MTQAVQPQKIVVGMSGGVDSSVTALLLKQQGHDVTGVFMQNWEDDNDSEFCSIKADSLDAMAVADLVGMDLDIVNFASEYKDRVFAYFLQEYAAGRTPNPDVLCNAEIKFKAFLEYALAQGADVMATGHYARKYVQDGQHFLLKGVDLSKDQSYFLYRLNQYQLSKAIFPLGDLPKSEVRRLAAQAQLPTAAKKDSTGICFIGERPFRQFLQQYLPTQSGDIVTESGRVIGQHMGLVHYTLGQRNLGIGGVKGAQEGLAWFVAAKDMAKNRLIVVQGHQHPSLFSKALLMTDLSWTSLDGLPPPNGRYAAKTRYRMTDAACQFERLPDGRARLVFDDAQWAVTPGQSAVLYDGDVCLGGGVIV